MEFANLLIAPNHWHVRIRMPALKRLAISLVIFLSGYAQQPIFAATNELPNYDRVRILAEARHIPDAELTDQDGRSFRISQLHGHVALV